VRKFWEYGIIIFSWGSFFLLAAILLCTLGYLLWRGGPTLGSELLFGTTAPLDGLLMREQVFDGLFPALIGTLTLIVLAVAMAVPIGVGGGIYMAEFAGSGSKRVLSALFDVLAGLPSIVIGLAGFSLSILFHRLLAGRFGPCLLLSAGSLGFLVLPYLVRSTQAALESIPFSVRCTAPALGATPIQNILLVLLPSRLPDILGGILLAIGRCAEDTAVIMLTGVVVSAGLPRSLFEQFEALPFYIYYISSQYTDPAELQSGFGAAILLLILCGTIFIITFAVEQLISHRLLK
jgi:phosphate transport system permease protein